MSFVNTCGSCRSVYAGPACPSCAGSPPPVPSSSSKAPALRGYEILSELGRGGMGVVYRARQTSLDRVVALKVLPPASSRDPEFQERFEREAKAMAALSHPNIVSVYDSGEADGQFFFSMEFIEGETLRARLDARKQLPPDEARTVAAQICDALDYAHGRGIVHRDVKPENVLIEPSGRVRLADFGLAKFAPPGAANLTATGAQLGTACYMAPEQLENPTQVDRRADLYAVGVMLYEMVSGRRPVGRFEPPPAFADVIGRAMSRDPGQRFADAAELRAALSGRAPASQAPWIAAAEAAVVLAIPLVWWLANRSKPAPAGPGPQPQPVVEAPLDLTRVRFGAADGAWATGMSTGHMHLSRIPQNADTPKGRQEIADLLDFLLVPARAAEIVDAYAAAWPFGTLIAVESPEAERMERDFRAWKEKVYRWSVRRGHRLVMVFSGPPARDDFVALVLLIQRKLGLPEREPE